MAIATKIANETCVYIDTKSWEARRRFADVFYAFLREMKGREVVVLCIGTNRAAGDSLGPLVGERLSEKVGAFAHVSVYGTLSATVHAKNLPLVMGHINGRHPGGVLVAVDASLGKAESVGCLTVGKGGLLPGAGLQKNMPPVGDIHVTGIVNHAGSRDISALQNAHLGLVVKMADVLSDGMVSAFSKISSKM